MSTRVHFLRESLATFTIESATVGPFVLFNAAMVGFFAFAAIYHLLLWWSSRREVLLAVFSADCAVRAVFSAVAVAVATTTTSAGAQSALHVRISVGILIMLTWVWILSLISGVRARGFVWPVTIFLVILFPLHTFLVPINSTVVSVEAFELPWGETISNPQLTSPGWWFGPTYAVVIAVELFGLYCGFRLWVRDHVAGSLILLANCSMLMVHAAHVFKAFGILNVPFFGLIGHVFWACLICLLIARRSLLLRKQLVASEQRFQGIFDQTFNFIGLMSTDGTVIEINRTALEFAGIRNEDVIGKPFWAMPWSSQSPDHQDQTRHAVRDAADGRMVRFEVTHSRPNGKLAHIDFSLKPARDQRGEITLLISEGRDITERKRIEEELRANRQRLESLSRQLITTQESERRRLARELHDQIGQMLTAIKMNLRRTQRVTDASLNGVFEENVKLVELAIGQVRNLSLSLRPPQLDELGLVAALHWLVKHQAQLGGFEEQLDVDLGSVPIQPALETVCFRIAQEALTNAVRHGHASKVHVVLRANENDVLLIVQDNGVGFEVVESRARAVSGSSIGLISMQERANLVGGQIEIESTPGHGTRIQAVLPMSVAVEINQ